MALNPFDTIDDRLRNIENLLLDLKNSSIFTENSLPKSDFKYMPIQEIFNKKICSKPTFYSHVKAGHFILYKFGNKSFVDAEEFLSAFHKVKFKQQIIKH